MARKVDDALAVLKGLLESLLISYRYDAADGVMSVVFDYPEQEPGADRAFVRFRFDGVSSFKRAPGLFAELQKFTDAYSTRETRGGSVLQKVSIRARGSSIRIVLGFGHSFGGVSFVCRGVTAETRNARAIRTGPTSGTIVISATAQGWTSTTRLHELYWPSKTPDMHNSFVLLVGYS
jgi:hypothetical protein